MYGNADLFQTFRLRPRLSEHVHIAGELELAGEPIGRVVIASDHEDLDARLTQAPHPHP